MNAVHTRAIHVEATRAGDHELEVTGRLLDQRPGGGLTWYGTRPGDIIHDMSLTLRVRVPELVITAVQGAMHAHPYTVCPEALPPLEVLVGLRVSRGFTRAVNERLGRERGCAHLVALVHAMAPVVRQAASAAFRDEREPPRAERDLWFIGTCHAWRDGGALAARLRAGDIEGLRALTARPVPPSDGPGPRTADRSR
jgi:hypothetical protein